MKRRPTCNQPREDVEFKITRHSPGGAIVSLDTRECVRCIGQEAKKFHSNEKRNHRKARSW